MILVPHCTLLPNILAPPWSMVVLIILGWFHSVFELRTSPAWLIMKVPSSMFLSRTLALYSIHLLSPVSFSPVPAVDTSVLLLMSVLYLHWTPLSLGHLPSKGLLGCSYLRYYLSWPVQFAYCIVGVFWTSRDNPASRQKVSLIQVKYCTVLFGEVEVHRRKYFAFMALSILPDIGLGIEVYHNFCT